jgi:hypothetical protein
VVAVDVVTAVVMLSAVVVLSLDSAPMRGVLYAVARWRRRRAHERKHDDS